jgi:hypothetical protein
VNGKDSFLPKLDRVAASTSPKSKEFLRAKFHGEKTSLVRQLEEAR